MRPYATAVLNEKRRNYSKAFCESLKLKMIILTSRLSGLLLQYYADLLKLIICCFIKIGLQKWFFFCCQVIFFSWILISKIGSPLKIDFRADLTHESIPIALELIRANGGVLNVLNSQYCGLSIKLVTKFGIPTCFSHKIWLQPQIATDSACFNHRRVSGVKKYNEFL